MAVAVAALATQLIPPRSAAEQERVRRCVEANGAVAARRPSLARAFRAGNGEQMAYRLFVPAPTRARALYPLVLSLHHAGARGSDNQKQLTDHAYGLGRFVSDTAQAQHPSYVLAPHTAGRWGDLTWSNRPTPPAALPATLPPALELVFGILDEVLADPVHGPRIDRRRIYVTGQSMGGYGAWAALLWRPELFAAAIPVCGGGHALSAARAAAVPIWAFHGDSDAIIDVSHTRTLVEALGRAGGQVRYWELAGLDHDETSEQAYCQPDLLTWLFAQRRAHSTPGRQRD